jgi:hypothetical protein
VRALGPLGSREPPRLRHARAAGPADPNRHSGGGVLSLVLEAGSPRAAAGSAFRNISGRPQGLASAPWQAERSVN